MFSNEIQRSVNRLIGFGVPLTSLILFTSGVTDPVNVTKMFVSGGVGVAGIALFLTFGVKQTFKDFKLVLITSILFTLACLNAVVFSNAPMSQNLFGTYGRNTGLLTYIFMVGVLICALMLQTESAFKFLVNGIIFTGIINITYCAWVLMFGDFLGWSNPYGNILGLFGNPDFISAFLGMFITSAIALSLNPKSKNWNRVGLVLASIIAFTEILKSHAVQGIVVTFGGIVIIGFYKVYSRFSGRLIPTLYILAASTLGVMAVLGALQKGPFKFVYKRSVSLRGSYWHAGISMGNENPLHGIGFDTYGDWYRRSRPPVALVDMPGVNTVSNVSHNVVIDFFASGGWPLLLTYLALLFFGLRSILMISKRNRHFNPIFVSLATTWMCYQVQSFISINQIGLTIWGWTLTGALIAYEKHGSNLIATDLKNIKNQLSKNEKSSNILSPSIVASLGVVAGLFFAAPALNSDMSWKSANQSRDLKKVEKTLVPTFMNPASSFKYAQAVDLLQRSNLLDLALQYSKKSVKFNPDYFDAWKQLYYLPNASSSDKNDAMKNMKRLDPLNPDVTQIG